MNATLRKSWILLAVSLALGCDVERPNDAKGSADQPAPAAARARKVHKAPDGATPRLAFVTNNASEFWKIAEKGLEKARKEHGIQIDIKQPTSGKVEEQKKIIEDLVSQGYHGIAVSVISPDDMVRDLDKAAEKLNVITHDSDAEGSNRLVYIGTNNVEAGRALGKELNRMLPGGGKIATFVGTLAAANARQRLDGIKQAIQGTSIEIITTKEDNKDESKARTNAEDVINANPDIACLVGLWAYNGPHIASAVKAAGKVGKIKIACFDEYDETLKGIEEGVIDCTVVQKPFEFGYRSAILLQALATKGEAALPTNDIDDTGVDVISKANVAAFQQKLADLKK